MKGRNGQVARIYKIISLLEGAPHGLTVGELGDRLEERGYEVGKRTLYRDLEALRLAGFPLEEKGKSDDMGVRWTLERNARINHYLVLSSRELLALYLARSVLEPLRETPFYEDLAATFHKIEDKIGTQSQKHLNELSQDLHFEPGPRWGLGLNPDVIDTVRAAVTEKHVLSIVYASVNSGTHRQRRVGPQFLYFARGSLYLVAEDLEDQKVKVFGLPRISSAVMTADEYTGGEGDPDQFFNHSFGVYRGAQPIRVQVLFGPKVSSFVKERRWHASQTVVMKEGGWIEVSLDVSLTPELVQWILGFGSNARVMAPHELIKQVQDEALATARIYNEKKAG